MLKSDRSEMSYTVSHHLLAIVYNKLDEQN